MSSVRALAVAEADLEGGDERVAAVIASGREMMDKVNELRAWQQSMLRSHLAGISALARVRKLQEEMKVAIPAFNGMRPCESQSTLGCVGPCCLRHIIWASKLPRVCLPRAADWRRAMLPQQHAPHVEALADEYTAALKGNRLCLVEQRCLKAELNKMLLRGKPPVDPVELTRVRRSFVAAYDHGNHNVLLVWKLMAARAGITKVFKVCGWQWASCYVLA